MNDLERFDPRAWETFRVVDRSFDKDTRTVVLEYALDDDERFVETVTFETPPDAGDLRDGAGFERALLHLHVAAGTSYYKTAAPATVAVEGAVLTPAEVEFHHRIYDEGLREFAVRNGLPVPRPVVIRPDGVRGEGASAAATRSDGSGGSGGLVVPMGGGKDSVVLAHAVCGLRPKLFAVNPHPLVHRLADRLGLDLLVVRRELSPRLATLNRLGARNGHVPITAIVSLIAVVGSFLYGYDTIAMAIERSASEETRRVGGVTVNHQYSKGVEFEGLLRRLLSDSIDSGLTYGSALRPYSELAIARAFSRLSAFHGTFCSCNQAFRSTAAAGDRWCGNCPKCRFVALVLAPYLAPDRVAAIIGRDLFADADQVDGFADLMSDEDKPFECVGERREAAAALHLLAGLPAWRGSVVVSSLAARAGELVGDRDVAELLTPVTGARFPDGRVADAVDELLAAA